MAEGRSLGLLGKNCVSKREKVVWVSMISLNLTKSYWPSKLGGS